MAGHTHSIKKTTGKGKPVTLNQSSQSPVDLLQQKPESISTAFRGKKSPARLGILKRFSPFLLTALFLPLLFTYWLIAKDGFNKWLLCFLCVVTEVNLFYVDVVLWRYFKGEKIFLIWGIEMFLLFVAAYFII